MRVDCQYVSISRYIIFVFVQQIIRICTSYVIYVYYLLYFSVYDKFFLKRI